MEERLKRAIDLAQKEVQILSYPDSRLYPLVSEKIQKLFPMSNSRDQFTREEISKYHRIPVQSVGYSFRDGLVQSSVHSDTLPQSNTNGGRSSPIKSILKNEKGKQTTLSGDRVRNQNPVKSNKTVSVKSIPNKTEFNDDKRLTPLTRISNKDSRSEKSSVKSISGNELKRTTPKSESKEKTLNSKQSTSRFIDSPTTRSGLKRTVLTDTSNGTKSIPQQRPNITDTSNGTKSITPKTRNEFIVPVVDSTPPPTRSGLRPKRTILTDFEKMRIESDGRLRLALQKAALAEKKLKEEQELLKKKRMRNVGPKVPSHTVKRSQAPVKVVKRRTPSPVKFDVGQTPSPGKENLEPNANPLSSEPTNPGLPKSPSQDKKDGSAANKNDPLKSQNPLIQSTSKKTNVKPIQAAEKKTITKINTKPVPTSIKKGGTNTSKPILKSTQPTETEPSKSFKEDTYNKQEIVNDLMNFLEAKLNPVIHTVQQQMNRVVERIEKSPEPVLPLIEQQIQTEEDEIEVIVIPNSLRDKQPVLLESNRQEILDSKPKVAFEEPIVISRTVELKDESPAPIQQKEILLLPNSVISSIQEKRDLRYQFAKEYFGYTDSIHPSDAIEIVSEEMMKQMMIKLVGEIDQVALEFTNLILEEECPWM